MSHNKNHDSQQLPVGRLGIISPYSCAELGTKVDKIRYSANEFDYNFYFVKIWSGTHNK